MLMRLGSFKGPIVVLGLLTVVGAVALTIGWNLKASPYAAGSSEDTMWMQCKEMTAGDSRAFAVCTCPIDQIMREEPKLMCAHVALVKQHAGSEGVSKAGDAAFEKVPAACKAPLGAKERKTYFEILEECRIRYMRGR